MPDLERKESVLLAPTAYCALCKLPLEGYILTIGKSFLEIRFRHQPSSCENSPNVYRLYAANQVELVKEDEK